MSQTDGNNSSSGETSSLINYLLAGSALGLGGGLAAGVIRMLRNNKKLRDIDSDDDILYLQKQSSISEGLMLGLGLGGGGYLGYLIGDTIINDIRKKQAQRDLDRAQKTLLGLRGYDLLDDYAHALELEATPLHKKANTGFINNVTTGAGALAALLMLTGGIASYNYLDSVYPVRKVDERDKSFNPKRYKILDRNNQLHDTINTDEEEEALIKSIVKSSSDMLVPAFMLHTTEKQASIASDIISTVAQGNAEKFEQAVNELGFETSLDLVKGASSVEVDPVAEELALLYCTKTASFSPQFNLLVASEFLSFNPDMAKQANSLTQEQLDCVDEFVKEASNLFKMSIASDLGATCEYLEKVASINDEDSDVSEVLVDTINKYASSFLITNNNSATASQLSGGGVAPASNKDSKIISKEAEAYKQAVEADKKEDVEDPIDQTLQSTSTTTLN